MQQDHHCHNPLRGCFGASVVLVGQSLSTNCEGGGMKTGYIIKSKTVNSTGLIFTVCYCHGDEEENVEQHRCRPTTMRPTTTIRQDTIITYPSTVILFVDLIKSRGLEAAGLTFNISGRISHVIHGLRQQTMIQRTRHASRLG